MVPELIIVALIIAWVSGGKPDRIADAKIKHVWLILVPVAIFIASNLICRFTNIPGKPIVAGNYVGCAAAVMALCFFNIRIKGAVLMALGLAMNAAAIIANGGVMPASKSAMLAVFGQKFVDQIIASPTNLYCITDNGARLWWLCDIIPKKIGLPLWRGVYSIGDMVMTLGICIAVIALSHQGDIVERKVRA